MAFDGPPPRFLITGSPAAGKSTIAGALARRFALGVHIEVDNLRDTVVSGVAHPDAVEWRPEMVTQLRVARLSAIQMSNLWRQEGFTTVIDDFCDPNLLVEYGELEEDPTTLRVCLVPSLEVALGRNAERYDDPAVRASVDEGVRMVTGLLGERRSQFADSGWHLIDNSELTVDEAASTIAALAENRR